MHFSLVLVAMMIALVECGGYYRNNYYYNNRGGNYNNYYNNYNRGGYATTNYNRGYYNGYYNNNNRYYNGYNNYNQGYGNNYYYPSSYAQPPPRPTASLAQFLGLRAPTQSSYSSGGINYDSYGNSFLGSKDNGIYLFCNGIGCPGRG
ncbi:hypothetical protein CAEBREN_17919 [Caenorhabditis brenneri]|uniref:Uncharacterized protein n=1 Tax=Caenorhabditis brenneri TaxID=135651 RepID=G0NBZ2_CAEBE|nr:hypothetical protein CAEBREN_17919 [Caenorhabditis brenneri]